MDERLVANRWERQIFDAALLEALGLRVIYRGVPSDAGGPDYQEAVFEIAGAGVVRGDVEFHVRASDWFRHGHARDPRYNGVVLHVVWTDDIGATVRADGVRVPTLALGDGTAVAGSGEAPRLLVQPCVRAFSALGSEELGAALRELGMQRFRERRDRFSADLTALPSLSGGDADQVIYTALLESLGYASNREAFRQLAELLPYRSLAAIPPGRRREALLDAAGLEIATPPLVPVRLPPEVWRLSRLRPQNHPVRRLAGLASLLDSTGGSLSGQLCDAVSGARRPADLRRALLSSSSGDGFIGRGRADEMAVSAVLPFAAAQMPDSPRPETLYAAYPSPPLNRWTRAMQQLFSQAGHTIRPHRAPEHQGIHLLFHRYCRAERSDRCPICRVAAVRLERP